MFSKTTFSEFKFDIKVSNDNNEVRLYLNVIIFFEIYRKYCEKLSIHLFRAIQKLY